MLANVLRCTASRAPHRVTLMLTRSKGTTSVPPPEVFKNTRHAERPHETSGDKASKVARVSNVPNPESSSKKSPKVQSDAAKADESKVQSPVTQPASTQTHAHASKSSVTAESSRPPATTTTTTAVKESSLQSERAADAEPNEERQWHASVVHGRGIFEAYRHPRTHSIPVASIQFRAHRPEPLLLATHFASHAAASLGIPLSGVVSLPVRRTLWTVPRGPFAHKKSQENFERRVHARAIKAFDADPEVVDRWVRYLEEHALPGVGMRVVRWHRLPIGVGRSHLQSVVGRMRLGRPTNKQKVKELGDKIVEVESKAAKDQAASASR